jgi:D-sedoheptulose 7-phosphate isomerase
MNFTWFTGNIEQAMGSIDVNKLERIINVLRNVGVHNKVLVCGNGGSFANAQHFAQDLQKMAGITSIALGSNPSYITAVSNDEKYSNIFRNELSNVVEEGDILFILTCSGNSRNVVKAAKYMNENDWGYTIALTGRFQKMKIDREADTLLSINSTDFGIIESVHSVLLHYITSTLAGDFNHA